MKSRCPKSIRALQFTGPFTDAIILIMKIGIISFGCPKNLTDTEVLMGLLSEAGYEITPNSKSADIILLNTCAFIKPAREEAYQEIKKFKDRELLVAGCLPKVDKNLLKKFPQIKGLINSIQLFDYAHPRIKATPPWTAYVKTAEGCDNCCSYCLVPKIRGPYRSRAIDDIAAEVEGLIQKGVKEINLVAQDTTYFKPGLDKLLERLVKIEGLRWLRILYAHPEHLTDKVIKMIAQEEKILKYIDLPLQHISDRILKLMGREVPRDIISKIREIIPEVAIRTTLMVGFPGEKEEDFRKLLSFVEKTKFERLGVFTYYKEDGTPAAKLRGQVPWLIKKSRYHQIMRLQNRISKELNKQMVGKELEVLIEKSKNGFSCGRSYREAPEIDGSVIVKGNLKPGEIVKVRVIKARAYDLETVPI